MRSTENTGRIDYIDGLKGLCGIWVCLLHYLLAFAAFGYIGWQSGVPAAEQAEVYFRYFPYSIFSNGSFPLYVFFAIIAFIPASRFFQTGNQESIKRQAVVRYFRFMPPVLVCSLSAYAIFLFGGFFNQELGALLGNNWDKAFYTAELSWRGALTNGLFDALWSGNGDYCSVLWCMNIIFLGSYASYSVLLFIGSLRRRYWFYAVLFGLSFTVPIYTAFLGGIVAADMLAHRSFLARSGRFGAWLAIVGVIIGMFPHVLLPPSLSVYTLYGVGAFLLLLGCGQSGRIGKFLSHRLLTRAGELSFSIVLAHFSILLSFSAWFFLAVHAQGLPYAWALALTLVTAIPANYAGAVLFKRFIEQPTEQFCRWLYHKVA